MGHPYRAIRGAATALLVAVAVGAGGTASMTSALAADPSVVPLHGTVVDGAGAPLAGVGLVISEELPPDGGLAGFQATTAADGTFSIDVYAWGSAAAPATLAIATVANTEIQVDTDGCSQTWGVEVKLTESVTFAEAVPDRLTVIAATNLLGEVCGTTATTPPGSRTDDHQPGLTPPPTDTYAARGAAGRADRLGPALLVGFAVGLLAAAALLLPRPGARRRD